MLSRNKGKAGKVNMGNEAGKKAVHRILHKTFAMPDKPMVYILRGSQGDMLVDTAYGAVRPSLCRWIREGGFDVKWIFLTHGHFDHVQNAPYLREKLNAKVIIHEADARYLAGARCGRVYPSSRANRAACASANALTARIPPVQCPVDITVGNADAGLLRELGFDADIVMLPGHTLGSMGISIGRALYCGDACSAKHGDYYTAMFGEDVEALYASERLMFDINPLIIAPGHGQYIVNERAF